MPSVGMNSPPSIFNRCPLTELKGELSPKTESRQNSMSHCERTEARGQFKIVSFSQEWFFPEASCGFNLKKAVSSSFSIWALCFFFAAFLSPQLYISLFLSWTFPFPSFFVSLQACAVAMRAFVCLEMGPSCIPSLYLGEIQVCSLSSHRRNLCHVLSGEPM